MTREFWRLVVVQKTVAQIARFAIEYPPMQAPVTFKLDPAKRQIQKAIKARAGGQFK